MAHLSQVTTLDLKIRHASGCCLLPDMGVGLRFVGFKKKISDMNIHPYFF